MSVTKTKPQNPALQKLIMAATSSAKDIKTPKSSPILMQDPVMKRATLILDDETHMKMGLAARLNGMTQSQWMARLITDACKDIIITDNRKP